MSKRPPQINIRVPEDLKDKLHNAANESGRSVNSEIVARLEKSLVCSPDESQNTNLTEKLHESIADQQLLAQKLQTAQELLGHASKSLNNVNYHVIPGICDSKTIRIISAGSTYSDTDRLATFFYIVNPINKIGFYVRDGRFNNGALTIVLYSEESIYIADGTPLTVERPPREREVYDLLADLDFKGLLDVAEFAVTRIDQTKDLPVEQALEELEQYETKPVRSNIYEFLSLFFPEPEKVKPDWFIDGWKELN